LHFSIGQSGRGRNDYGKLNSGGCDPASTIDMANVECQLLELA
jgi:hypothetical protein